MAMTARRRTHRCQAADPAACATFDRRGEISRPSPRPSPRKHSEGILRADLSAPLALLCSRSP